MTDEIKRFPCPQCGADLAFSPDVAQLQCQYCGWEDAIPEGNTAAIAEQDYNAHRQRFTVEASQLSTLSQTALEVDCDNCGAAITFEPPQTAGTCPFCAAAIVAQAHTANPVIAPQGVVPFSIGRREALKQFKQWLKAQWLAPNNLTKLAQGEQLQGMYLPFWTYDADTASRYRGERGEYYYTTETYQTTDSEGKSVTKTRQVRHTRWYPARGHVSRFFDDVLVAASTAVERQRLDALEPWGLPGSLQPYNASFLAGFEAQRPQVSLEEGFQLAKGVMDAQIRRDVERDIGGDDQRVHSVSTQYDRVTFKHILLPVWLTAYRYNNKQFQVLINAITGEVQGDHPYSVWKVTLLAIAGLIGAAIVVWLIMKYG
ncbi:TFIIB-type zinc finger domain-containing protein [Spirulina major CS-329]|uniref:TFIIB-type zinc finger domain-containing protein n=1 Tax=Spirulina TaxID=1154 RepID=UPI0023309243|nr:MULTISPECIES: TFIIB-type zinc finger domain-containing protein [Spirulina]MDB9495392.1 TFIIB-type zinc finger domain-containing protein [Spirulina subsalsa CS-330]MDB9501937.1 TFIIB-type zinc finger domain-containing protein [Spirulina major CS-329]